MVPTCEVNDKVGGGIEDEGEVVETGQAEDPWVDFACADVFSGTAGILHIAYCISMVKKQHHNINTFSFFTLYIFTFA